ncbi:MAG: 3-oxoacyl-[acyl-carrier-protein] reductase [Syntrophales bacterium]
MGLEGKTALVTGASRGIGRAVALRLAGAGAFTCLNYANNKKAAAETLRMITNAGGQGKLVPFDVADYQATQEAIRRIIRERGSIDVLVNNAGIRRDSLIVRMREDDWDKAVDVNLKGTFNCCRGVARQMMKQRSGRIINITSVVAEGGNAGQVNYCASKAGILGLTKSLARELGPRNICVNAVAPGFIETDMTEALEAEKEAVRKAVPLARLGCPDDVAGVVLFLASEDARYITGQVVRVNGGLYM